MRKTPTTMGKRKGTPTSIPFFLFKGVDFASLVIQNAGGKSLGPKGYTSVLLLSKKRLLEDSQSLAEIFIVFIPYS